MDPDQAVNPPDLLGPHDSSSPIFSCFLDCCKPTKKGTTPQEADEDHVTSEVKNEELKAKEKGNEKQTRQSVTLSKAKQLTQISFAFLAQGKQ